MFTTFIGYDYKKKNLELEDLQFPIEFCAYV